MSSLPTPALLRQARSILRATYMAPPDTGDTSRA